MTKPHCSQRVTLIILRLINSSQTVNSDIRMMDVRYEYQELYAICSLPDKYLVKTIN